MQLAIDNEIWRISFLKDPSKRIKEKIEYGKKSAKVNQWLDGVKIETKGQKGGGYYTGENIAKFILRYAIQKTKKRFACL